MHPFLLATRIGWFAEGRFLGKVIDGWVEDAQEFIRGKLPHLLVVALIAFVLNRLLGMVTNQMISLAERHAPGQNRVAQVKTLAGAIRVTGLATIGVIVGLQFLAAVGINLAPLLTSAGIAGVAIGLAAQNVVRDVFNGVLILIEDQFNVGDVVRIAGVSGTVETMNLRKTTVRDIEGTLYVIPNSQIGTVANLSSGFSVAWINVSVDFSANPGHVLDLLKSIAIELRESEEFKPVFLADPQVLGVDALRGSEVVFQVVFKTLANRQFAPVREFRRRVRLALEERHLLPGDPMRVFSYASSAGDEGALSGPLAEEAGMPHDPTAIAPRESHPFGSA
jgi:small-conductance mechanosensitive channel